METDKSVWVPIAWKTNMLKCFSLSRCTNRSPKLLICKICQQVAHFQYNVWWLGANPHHPKNQSKFCNSRPSEKIKVEFAKCTNVHYAALYTHTKKIHLDTAQVCRSQGVDFRPLVAETTRGMDDRCCVLPLAVWLFSCSSGNSSVLLRDLGLRPVRPLVDVLPWFCLFLWVLLRQSGLPA